MSLEAFARSYRTFGEKIIAAEMVSMLNDKLLGCRVGRPRGLSQDRTERFVEQRRLCLAKAWGPIVGKGLAFGPDTTGRQWGWKAWLRYFGQWLALNVPFKKLEDLLLVSVVARVPSHVQFLACALEWAPEMWRSEEAIREHLALRAVGAALTETVVQMIRAQDFFTQQHLTGALVAQDQPVADVMQSYFDTEDGVQLTPEQKRVIDNVNQRVDQALAIAREANEEEVARLQGLVEEHGSMVAVLGEPGTGKTAVLDRCVRRAQALGARVLLAMPTGAQRARVKQRHPDVDLDTCHGAFLFHKPLVEALGIMMGYDLIVIDEAPQLFAEHFARLHEMWLAAGKIPCVVLAGDEWQLPPPDHTKELVTAHPKWKSVYKIQLHKVWRQTDGDPLLKKLGYLRKNRPMGADGDAFLRELCRRKQNRKRRSLLARAAGPR
jgi:hypothetical protein